MHCVVLYLTLMVWNSRPSQLRRLGVDVNSLNEGLTFRFSNIPTCVRCACEISFENSLMLNGLINWLILKLFGCVCLLWLAQSFPYIYSLFTWHYCRLTVVWLQVMCGCLSTTHCMSCYGLSIDEKFNSQWTDTQNCACFYLCILYSDIFRVFRCSVYSLYRIDFCAIKMLKC